MTQADYGVALTLFLVTGLFTVYQRFGPMRQERLKVCRYKLFALRDELVRLVAKNKIAEDDPVFRFLYDGVNQIIPQTKPLTLWGLVQALKHSEFARVRDDESRQWFLSIVNHQNPSVRSVARKFLATLADILFDRSPVIRAAAKWTHSSVKFVEACRDGLSWLVGLVSTSNLEAYRYYKAIQAINAS